MTHPAVLRKMRAYAIKQALTELEGKPTPAEIEKVAKRHMLSYTELKQALNRERHKETTVRDGANA